MWTDTDVPNRDRVESSRWGVAPSIGFGTGTSTRATVSYFKLKQDNLPEYGLPWVPVNTNPELAAYSNGAPPVDQSNFYGLVTRDYEKTDTDLATVDVAHDFGQTTVLRNLTRWGRNVRDSVITAPRFVAVNTSTAINRQLQSRDMTDEILANQTNLTSRFSTGRMVTPSRPASSSPPSARSTTRGPVRPRRRRISTIRIRSILTPARSCAAAPSPTARRSRPRPTRSIPSTSAAISN